MPTSLPDEGSGIARAVAGNAAHQWRQASDPLRRRVPHGDPAHLGFQSHECSQPIAAAQA
jgi:hypothetical protein